MCGRPLRCKGKMMLLRGRVQSCVRPVVAALMTADPDEVRERGSDQFVALESA